MRESGIRAVGRPRQYRIILEGELSRRFVNEFQGMNLESGGGKTLLWGEIVDQSHLHGVLHRVEDLGLTLLSVSEVPGGSGERSVDP
jgi:hypothetical protein